jgi:hypothetical protein
MPDDLPPIPCTSQEIIEMHELLPELEKECGQERITDLNKARKITRLRALKSHVDKGGSLELTYIITIQEDADLKNKRVEMHMENKRKL